MEVKELKFADGAGGLNNRDHPSQIQQNEFSVLENILTDEGGWPGKKRLGQDLMQYAPIEPSPFRGAMAITALPDGSGPGAIRVVCASTEGLAVGQKVTFYNAVVAVVEANVTVTEVTNGTTFKVTNTVALAVGNTFKPSGCLQLWHMDALAGNEPSDTVFENTSPYVALALQETPAPRTCPSVDGLFPIGGPLARLCQPAVDGVFFDSYGHFFKSLYNDLIDGLPSVCFQGWIYINPSFSGKPVTIDITGAGHNFTFSNSGAHILATQAQGGWGGPPNLGEARNGVTIYRDWDAVNNTHASDPYLTFTLYTQGAGKQVLTSKYLPMGVWLFFRATYNQATGKIRLRVNGTLHAEAAGSGLVDDNIGLGVPGILFAGGSREAQFVPFFASLEKGFDGRIEEMQILTGMTDAEESVVPFKEPRGKPWPLVKANGTRQLVVGAGDGLYYTVGDGAWTKMNDAVRDHLGAETFSSVAYWDAVQIGDALFLQNGTDPAKMWDGTKLYPWGNPATAPTLTPVAAAAGVGYIGTIDYYVTFMFGSRETGLSPLAQVTTVALTDQVQFANIPIGPPGCTGRRVYRKKATGATAGNLYLLREIADNVTTTMAGAYTAGAPAGPDTDTGRDGVADATLGTGAYVDILAEVQFSAIPKGKYLLANHNRPWIAGVGDDQYAVFYGERDYPHICLPQNYVRATADSGPIIGLAKYYGEIHASKGGKSTLVLRGDNPSNWTQWEVLHPTIGAVDHWSYVHRTIPQSDSYRLCFWAADGAYAYAGQDFEKISDLVNGTTQGLTVDNGNKLSVNVTTRSDWESAPSNSGSISVNAYQPRYEQDGTREVPGQLRSVNQLDYVGLWNPLNPPAAALTGTRVIAVCKGVNEGEFYFSTNATNDLWFTADNFVSAASVGTTSGSMTERIIEIVRRGTDNYFFLLMDSATGDGLSSAGGSIYSWDGAVFALVYAGALFYNLDVPIIAKGNPFGPLTSGGSTYIPPNAPNNAFVNHAQTVRVSGFVNSYSTVSHVYKTGGLNVPGVFPGNWYASSPLVGPGAFNWDVFLNAADFYQFSPNDNTGVANTSYTRREFPLWLGGTFRPQAYWDAANARLMFVAADAPDGFGNCLARLRTVTSAGVLTNWRSNVSSFTSDGVNVWAWELASNATGGFTGTMRRATLVAPGVNTLSSAAQANLLALRLAYNSADAVKFVGAFKDWNNGTQNYWAYKGSLQAINLATLAPSSITSRAVNGDSGPFFCELLAQPTTPQSWYAAVSKVSATQLEAVFSVAAGSMAANPYKVTPYTGSGATAAATGVRSNMIFVAASGAPSYSWADRLYFYTDAVLASNQRMVQLGVPGTWRVVVDYLSSAFQTAGFEAFDSLASDYQGAISFFLRNAGSIPGLAATEQAVIPNTNLNLFPNPASIFQFRMSLVWDYSVASPLAAPYVDFVEVGYFTGTANLPRVVGWHWKGRTYWSVAEVGQQNNSLVLVYQKNNRWTLYTGWAIKGTAEFLGKLVALQSYELVQLEVGKKDLGNLIRTRARTGAIMEDWSDKCIRDAHFNVLSWVNSNFPTKSGWMKLVPYGGDVRLAADWVFELPATPAPQPRQVKCEFTQATFPYQYARALALEVLTSDDTGAYAPVVDQDENMASLMVRLFVSPPRERIVRP